MVTRNVNEEYFRWLCFLINDSKKGSYNKLLNYLYDTEFVYIMPMDGNRYEDGINMRYRFGRDNDIEDMIIASCLDDRPCSILEMMVALAVRIEEHIMINPENGMMPGRWFWKMIENLGLINMTDRRFDGEYVNSVVWRFLNREYGPNGEGSLVHIPDRQYDIKSMEIWYQMMRYLSIYRRNEGE